MSHGYAAISTGKEVFLSYILNNPFAPEGSTYFHLVPAGEGDEAIGYVNHDDQNPRGFLWNALQFKYAQASNELFKMQFPEKNWVLTPVKLGGPA